MTSHQVVLKAATKAKSLLALDTLVGFLSGVDTQVRSEILRLAKTSATLGALKWLFPRMHSHVYLEILPLVEQFIAILAGELFPAVVAFKVLS